MPNHNLQVGVSPDYLNFLQPRQKMMCLKWVPPCLQGPACCIFLFLPLPYLEASKVDALPPSSPGGPTPAFLDMLLRTGSRGDWGDSGKVTPKQALRDLYKGVVYERKGGPGGWHSDSSNSSFKLEPAGQDSDWEL